MNTTNEYKTMPIKHQKARSTSKSVEDRVFQVFGIFALIAFGLTTWDLFESGELSVLSFNMTYEEIHQLSEAFMEALFSRVFMLGIFIFFGGFALLNLIKLIQLFDSSK
ncbi:hypothetical protein ACT4XR_20290 (plasmid) [Acinetobacter baumannii]|uniref:hypothetical protein n=1 Tax=Acinetobacter baumannii TaxID=470 RepID=UPI0038925E59